MMKRNFIILFSTLSLLFSGFSVAEENSAAEEYMEANYGPDKSKWPIWDTPPAPVQPGESEVEVGPMTDPNHGKNILERHMGDH